MPNRVDFHVKRGDLLTRLNRREDAFTEFESALKLNPELDDLRMRVILSYVEVNRTDDARRHLQERMKSVPSEAVIRTKYAESAVRGGLFDEATAYSIARLRWTRLTNRRILARRQYLSN